MSNDVKIRPMSLSDVEMVRVFLSRDLPDSLFIDELVDKVEATVKHVLSRAEELDIRNIEFVFFPGKDNVIYCFYRNDNTVMISISLSDELITLKTKGADGKPLIRTMINERLSKLEEEFNSTHNNEEVTSNEDIK